MISGTISLGVVYEFLMIFEKNNLFQPRVIEIVASVALRP